MSEPPDRGLWPDPVYTPCFPIADSPASPIDAREPARFHPLLAGPPIANPLGDRVRTRKADYANLSETEMAALIAWLQAPVPQ